MIFFKRPALQKHSVFAIDDAYRNRPMPPSILMRKQFRSNAGHLIVFVDQNDEVVVDIHWRILLRAKRQQASPKALQWVSTTFAFGDTRA